MEIGFSSTDGCLPFMFVENDLKGTKMAEKKVEVRTYHVDYICDKCGEGFMRSTGMMLDSYPPQYPLKCSECGHEQTFSKCYPVVGHERID
jgi:predicted RNA-binding Zn-ribbon protein involved in translation (DUF1610 family)